MREDKKKKKREISKKGKERFYFSPTEETDNPKNCLIFYLEKKKYLKGFFFPCDCEDYFFF